MIHEMNNDKNPRNFEIEFLDTSELIDFVADSRNLEKSKTDSTQEAVVKKTINVSKSIPGARDKDKLENQEGSTEEPSSQEDLTYKISLEDELDEDEFEDYTLPYTNQIIEEASEYVVKRKEDTRGRLALAYTIFTFIIFIIGIFICVLDGLVRGVSIIDNLSTVLPLLSGLFLGTLGFVLGYYFRGDNE